MQSYFFAFAFIFFICSCQKSVEDPSIYKSSFNPNWIPLKIGYWAEYREDSFIYTTNLGDTFTKIQTHTNYYRSVVEDTISGFYPQTVFKIAIYKRQNTSSLWKFDHYYTSYAADFQILENNNNNQVISVQGPISYNTKWQGYQYIDSSITNPFATSFFFYQAIVSNFTFNSFQFDSTIQIVRYIDSNAIEYKASKNWYALGVGMIYSSQSNLSKQDAIKPWSEPEDGWKIERTITNWKR